MAYWEAATREVTSLTEKAKRDFYLDKSNNINSCKDLFHISNDLLGKQTNSPFPYRSYQYVADMFSSYFTEKISKIRNTLDSVDTIAPEW